MTDIRPRKYFNLNIRCSELGWRATDCLNDKLLAPVFYGKRTIDEIREWNLPPKGAIKLGQSRSMGEAKTFLDVHSKPIEPVFVTIDEGKLWIYTPFGEPFARAGVGATSRKSQDVVTAELPKAYNIRHLPIRGVPVRGRTPPLKVCGSGISTAAVPLILSSMKVNQAFSRNTFTEIGKNGKERYRGNIAAIKYVLGEDGGDFKVDPLDCLSSVELETLIAKLLEAHDCFVPAYRGGVIKDVDLYAYPSGTVRVGDRNLQPDDNGALSVQLKLSAENDAKTLADWIRRSPENVLISLDRDVPDTLAEPYQNGKFLNRGYVWQWISETPKVNKWLERSLEWLPQEWRKKATCSALPSNRQARNP